MYPMHPDKSRAFAERLERVVALMDSDEHLELVAQSRTERVVHENVFLQFSEVTRPDFDDLMAKMRLESNWAAKFSVKRLREEVLSAIVAVKAGRSAEEYVLEMSARLDADRPRHRVLVPLSGVLLASGVNLNFGRVVLLQMTETFFQAEVAGKLDPVVTVVGADDLFLYTVNVSNDLDQQAVYATYVVDTDAIKAAELVDDYVGPVADFLQFCLAETSERYSCLVDYKGRYHRKNVNTAVVVDEESGRAQLLSLDERTAIRMTINDTLLATWTELGLVNLAPVFGNGEVDQQNEYTQLLYRAIRVFAEGERSTSPRQRVLSYVTACELFFTEKSDTYRAVTEGVAFLLGTNYEERQSVLSAMRKMYDARSSATHSGLEPSSVALYRAQVLHVVRHLIRLSKSEPERFKEKKDIAAWIDRQRFSGPVVP